MTKFRLLLHFIQFFYSEVLTNINLSNFNDLMSRKMLRCCGFEKFTFSFLVMISCILKK